MEKLEVPGLPREVWHLVLSHLPHRHLARAILVCQDWAQAASDPHLWKDFNLRLASEESSGLDERLARLLHLHRFSRLQKLELAHVAAGTVPLATTLDLSTHQVCLIASSSITSLRLDNCDLSGCNEESLAAMINNLTALDLEDVRWGPGQAHEVITHMAQGTKLKSLKISCPFSSQEEEAGSSLPQCRQSCLVLPSPSWRCSTSGWSCFPPLSGPPCFNSSAWKHASRRWSLNYKESLRCQPNCLPML